MNRGCLQRLLGIYVVYVSAQIQVYLGPEKDEAGQIIAMPFLSISGGLNDILR